MKGTYKGFSYTMYYISVFVLIIFSMLSGAVINSLPAMIVFFIIAVGGGSAMILFASRIPCRFRTDEKGFTVSEMGFETRFEYSSITDISFEYVHGRYGGMIKLTIMDDAGETQLREVCSSKALTEFMNDPAGGKRPQLVQLCEYVKTQRGKTDNEC